MRRLARCVAAIVLLFAASCDPQPATVKPTTSQMAGHYTTSDKRAPGSTLDLRADLTFTLKNWPDRNGSGTWEIVQNNQTHTWDFNLEFATPTPYGVHGYQVLGGPGNYSLGFFISDPDEGAVVFRK